MSASAQPAATAVRRPFRALRFTRDEELVRLVRAGDERAFEVLYDRHHRGILAFCRHMLGSAEEGEDAVQHTFIAAHRDIAGSDKPIQLKAWLYAIARNRCLSILRARKEERALDDVPEPSVEGLAVAVQRRQDLRDLLADLQRLPEDQRAALVLSELGALSHDEIGTTLGVRKDKVKALVFQAREALASSRTAREADCREIQEQLSVLRGGSLRRTTLRRHVEVCPACAAFKAEVRRQRGAMAAVLPVIPSLALKETVLAGIFAAGGGAAGGGGALAGGLLAASGTKALVAKVATIAVVAGGATGGGLMAVDEISNGGEGNTATAMAGIPPEQRSVQMVGSLRRRAKTVAAERAADRRAGSLRPASAGGPEASTTGDAEVLRGRSRRAEVRAERRGEAERTAGITGQSRGTGAPVADPAPPPAPETPAPPPPAAAPPAATPQVQTKDTGRDRGDDDDDDEHDDDDDDERRGGDDDGDDDGEKGERRHRRKSRERDWDDAPKVTPPPAPVPLPQPERPRGKDDRKRKDWPGRRGRGPKAPTPLPQPAPRSPQERQDEHHHRDDRDDRDRGDDDDRDEDAKKAYAAAGLVEPKP